MAFFTPSCLISQIRGSVGNQTFSRNAHGAIVKEKLVQTVTSTAAQIAYRDDFAEGVANWQGFSDAQRKRLYLIAKDFPRTDSLGKKQILTGYHFYLSMWMAYKGFDTTYNALHRKHIPEVSPINYVFSPDSGGMRLNFSIPSLVSSKFWQVSATDQISAGIKYLSPSRFKIIINGSTFGSHNTLVTSDWESVYGAYTEDLTKNVWIKVSILYGFSSQIMHYWPLRLTPL